MITENLESREEIPMRNLSLRGILSQPQWGGVERASELIRYSSVIPETFGIYGGREYSREGIADLLTQIGEGKLRMRDGETDGGHQVKGRKLTATMEYAILEGFRQIAEHYQAPSADSIAMTQKDLEPFIDNEMGLNHLQSADHRVDNPRIAREASPGLVIRGKQIMADIKTRIKEKASLSYVADRQQGFDNKYLHHISKRYAVDRDMISKLENTPGTDFNNPQVWLAALRRELENEANHFKEFALQTNYHREIRVSDTTRVLAPKEKGRIDEVVNTLDHAEAKIIVVLRDVNTGELPYLQENLRSSLNEIRRMKQGIINGTLIDKNIANGRFTVEELVEKYEGRVKSDKRKAGFGVTLIASTVLSACSMLPQTITADPNAVAKARVTETTAKPTDTLPPRNTDTASPKPTNSPEPPKVCDVDPKEELFANGLKNSRTVPVMTHEGFTSTYQDQTEMLRGEFTGEIASGVFELARAQPEGVTRVIIPVPVAEADLPSYLKDIRQEVGRLLESVELSGNIPFELIPYKDGIDTKGKDKNTVLVTMNAKSGGGPRTTGFWQDASISEINGTNEVNGLMGVVRQNIVGVYKFVSIPGQHLNGNRAQIAIVDGCAPIFVRVNDKKEVVAIFDHSKELTLLGVDPWKNIRAEQEASATPESTRTPEAIQANIENVTPIEYVGNFNLEGGRKFYRGIWEGLMAGKVNNGWFLANFGIKDTSAPTAYDSFITALKSKNYLVPPGLTIVGSDDYFITLPEFKADTFPLIIMPKEEYLAKQLGDDPLLNKDKISLYSGRVIYLSYLSDEVMHDGVNRWVMGLTTALDLDANIYHPSTPDDFAALNNYLGYYYYLFLNMKNYQVNPRKTDSEGRRIPSYQVFNPDDILPWPNQKIDGDYSGKRVNTNPDYQLFQ